MLRTLFGLALAFGFAATTFADPPSLLKRMFRRDTAAPAKPLDETLKKEDGPFMILAATLVGQNSKARAEKLAAEIRRELGLRTFLYNENFDFTQRVDFDAQTSRTTRYANPYKYQAWAVLVGEYDTIKHPALQKDLERIKRYEPQLYHDPEELNAETDRNTPVTMVKSITNQIRKAANRQGKDYGPMALAFATRNPLLPAEYFQTPEVDDFIERLNQDKKYSLLECPGKYTVVVKTFRGASKIINNKPNGQDLEPSADRLAEIMHQANRMVLDLRKRGVKAYQYHDRNRSLVTVGSFESLGTELPEGKFRYDDAILQVMRDYSVYNVPQGQAAQVPQGKGLAANAAALIPFDVQPRPFAVPKPSKRSLYGFRR
ncbi:MAG: hypothetical protein AAF958_18220 [Planctomycetota bacterium]